MSLSKFEHRLTSHLAQYISDHKKEFAERVLANRTRQITVVLEDIYQSQNASAVVRTCECFGIQDIHIIENRNRYEVNRYVVRGSFKWENLIRYNSKEKDNTEVCYNYLRNHGYTIVATDPSEANIPVGTVNCVDSKIALVFGNELSGLSESALKNADYRVRIPTVGFTESLNISVSVAVCLTFLVHKLQPIEGKHDLSEEEKDSIRLSWYRKMVRNSDIIEKEFLRSNP